MDDVQLRQDAWNIYASFGVLGVTAFVLGVLFLWDRKRIIKTIETDNLYIRTTLTGLLVEHAKILGECTAAFRDNAAASTELKSAIGRIGNLHTELGEVKGAVAEVSKKVAEFHKQDYDARHQLGDQVNAVLGDINVRLAKVEDKTGKTEHKP